MKFFVIGDRETVLGLRLVGVEGVVATERGQALSALNDAVADKDIGVILIVDRLAKLIRDEVDARLYGFGFPLVLEIANASGPAPGRPRVEDIVRQAIGVSI